MNKAVSWEMLFKHIWDLRSEVTGRFYHEPPNRLESWVRVNSLTLRLSMRPNDILSIVLTSFVF